MSSKITLLIDMDGVLCEWYSSVMRRVQLENPEINVIPEDAVTEFYIDKIYPERYKGSIQRALTRPGLYLGLDPVQGAIEALKDIETNLTDSIQPVLCTSPTIDYDDQLCYSEKARWVEKHLGRWWVERLVLTKDKTLVRGHVLIDDKPNITGCMEPVWQQLVYDRGWNRHIELPRFTWAEWPALRESLLSFPTTP